MLDQARILNVGSELHFASSDVGPLVEGKHLGGCLSQAILGSACLGYMVLKETTTDAGLFVVADTLDVIMIVFVVYRFKVYGSLAGHVRS